MTPRFEVSPELDRFLSQRMRIAAGTGILLLIASTAGGFAAPKQFFHAYLFGYLFWLGVALGSLALLMTQYLTGGAWGVITRRSLEAAARTLPLMALLFVPVAFGMRNLYPWARPNEVAQDDVLRHRSCYMSPEFFIARAAAYFAIWIALIWLLDRWSREEDTGRDRLRRLERLSAPGLILFVFTVTFSAVDWAESLFAHWYSTMWGFLFVAGDGLNAMGVAILAVSLLARFLPFSEAFRGAHLHDLGKLLLMFVMLWAYFAFSQLLIVWSGNLTSEISWYFTRWRGSWAVMGFCIIVFEFLVPFLMLLSRSLKRNTAALSAAVILLLVMRMIDLYWVVVPALDRNGIRINWMQFALPLAIGGIWIAAFFWELRRRPLLPLGAPNLDEALAHGGSGD